MAGLEYKQLIFDESLRNNTITKVYFVEEMRNNFFEAREGYFLNCYKEGSYKEEDNLIAIVTLGSFFSCVVRHVPLKKIYKTKEEAILEADKRNQTKQDRIQ